jgi:hypothetical protein
MIGIVHLRLMFFNARYISLKTASSFWNSARFFETFRSGFYIVRRSLKGGVAKVSKKPNIRTGLRVLAFLSLQDKFPD